MMCRCKAYRAGDLVRIKDCVSHNIPAGLVEGQQVRVVAREIGSTTVEDESGNVWSVPMVLIDSGLEYLHRDGKWREKGVS